MNLPAFHDSPLAHMTPEQRLAFFDGAKRRADAQRRQSISDALDALWRRLSLRGMRSMLARRRVGQHVHA
jgi:hypothetical protein